MSEFYPTTVQLPGEPCVVLSDGELVTILTDRAGERIETWCLDAGPIARAVMATRLHAIAQQIEGFDDRA